MDGGTGEIKKKSVNKSSKVFFIKPDQLEFNLSYVCSNQVWLVVATTQAWGQPGGGALINIFKIRSNTSIFVILTFEPTFSIMAYDSLTIIHIAVATILTYQRHFFIVNPARKFWQ